MADHGIERSHQNSYEQDILNIPGSSSERRPITDPALSVPFVSSNPHQAMSYTEETITQRTTDKLTSSWETSQNTDGPIVHPTTKSLLLVGIPHRASHQASLVSPHRRFRLIIGICLILLITLGGLIFYTHTPGVHSPFKQGTAKSTPALQPNIPRTGSMPTSNKSTTSVSQPNIPHMAATPTSNKPTISVSLATITLTPDQQILKKSITVQAVNGTLTDPQTQVQARKVTVTAPPVVETVNASGIGVIPATQAKGTVTFFNAEPIEWTYLAGTMIPPTPTPTQPIQVEIEQDVHVGAYPGGQEAVTVPAHAVVAGASGNISANSLTGHGGSNRLLATNSQFVGGLDQSTYPYIQQSDIDQASNNLIASHKPDTSKIWGALQKQLSLNEQFVGNPLCKPQTSATQAAGDKVATVTVSVIFTCLAYASNRESVAIAAQNQFLDLVSKKLGSDYTLQGNIATTIQSADIVVIQYGNEGDVPGVFSVEVTGAWAFQITDAQKQQWLNTVAGKNQQEAQTFLQSQRGVKEVTIQLEGKKQEILPTNLQDITWKIVA